MSHPTDGFLEDSFFSEMLCSQSDLESQILSLQEFINSDCCMEDKLDKLHDFLSSTIKNVSIDTLDEKIFNTALVIAQKMYSEVIKIIHQTLEYKQNSVADELKNHLNTLINLIKCWDLSMDHIKTLEKVSIMDIKSFPPSFFDVMVNTLSHCKASASNYGDYFEAASEQLKSLFRRCSCTLNTFYALMDTAILFETSQEDQMNILIKIIDETGKLATLTSSMDVKTLTDMWKRFGKLSSNYTLQMKNISPNTITDHFKGLSESIVIVLLSVSQKNQRSSNERSVLCCRLLLNILEKLCESYCGWIKKDVMIGMITMITKLYRYTEQFLKISDFNADFIKFIISNFTFMIDPFLDVVFKNDTFKLAMFDYGKSVKENFIGYHLLLLAIMKKISTCPYEKQREWCIKENCVFETCFQNIDKLTQEICLGKLQIQISRDIIKGSYITNIYEATCLSIFALVCQISNSDFFEFTMILLKYLMSGKFFGSLLSSDVWCFVCRLGSSEMCYSHFKYLVQVYEMLKERKNNLNVVMLSNLINRQYSFLSNKDKIDFINSIVKSSDPHRWSSIAEIMDKQKKKQLQQQIDAFSINTRISDDLKNLEEQPSLKYFCLLIQDLLVIQATNLVQDEGSIETFTKMWNKIASTLGDCEDTAILLLETLTISLLRATNAKHTQTKYTTSVLKSITVLYSYASSSLRLEFCRFCNRVAVNLTDNDSALVAELFCRLLSDSEPCVQQEAFESFEQLTRTCPNSGLLSTVALSIKNAQSEISRTLPAYISGEMVHQLVGFMNMDDFYAALAKVTEKSNVHVCQERISVDRENKVLKLDEDLEKQAEKACNDMESVLRLKGQLKRDSWEKLRRLCQRFLDEDDSPS